MKYGRFDWVRARCECSPGKVFEKLKDQVRNDVANREETLTKAQKERFKFSFVPDRSEFSVFVEGNNIHGLVRFGLTETGIVVINESREPVFSADVTISDEGECKLKVAGEEKELWQVRKMALESFLFRKW